MQLNLRILVAALTAAVAFRTLLDAKERNSQPNVCTRVKLWCSGFALGFSIGWLITGGTFTYVLWIKLLAGIILGFQWAYRVVETIRATSMRSNMKSKKEEDKSTT